ncbi:MAG: FHA domain-containing protein, partial [Sphingomonadaceae bacterium]|nr:FHA domain-containing protein [Sphingomonadaceae bacterium]
MSAPTYLLELDAAAGHPAERRTLRAGALTIGRDPASGWVVEEPGKRLSRTHCRLDARPDGLFATDLSANGTFVNDSETPIGTGTAARLVEGNWLRLGGRRIAVSVERVAIHATEPHGESDILAAFCAGAGLDPSVFAARDMLDVMEELGGIYREMLAGLCALMQARAAARADLALDGTTLHAGGNNPFKWACAASLARDLLDAKSAGYLDGARAVKASFEDLTAHHAALASALPAAARLALDAVKPEAIELATG